MNRKKILLVDDDAVQLTVRKVVLELSGYAVFTARDARRSMELLESEAPDAVVLDYDMPVNGGVLARRMRRRNESVPIVMLSGCVSVPSRALDAVDAFVPKSTPPSLLMHTIEDVTLAGKVLP